MYFYIDESGNTGNNLFDNTQPVLSYGLLSCETNLDIRGRAIYREMLGRLGVEQLHASELREEGLAEIADLLHQLQKKLRFDFDYYFVNKRDFALVTFFDHAFDNVLNPAVPWVWYQTPMRYFALLGLDKLFDDELLQKAWLAATCTNRDSSIKLLGEVLPELLARVECAHLDSRGKQIFRETFEWANGFPAHLDFNASDKWQTHFMGPNLVGFQFVLIAIARRLKAKGREVAAAILVDRQHQYNAIQQDLHSYYQRISEGIKVNPFPSRNYLDYDFNKEFGNIPAQDLEVMPSGESIGLQIADICLWLFNRHLRLGELDFRFAPLLERLYRRSVTDGIHMGGIADRWSRFETELPAFTDINLERARELLDVQERARQAAMTAHRQIYRRD